MCACVCVHPGQRSWLLLTVTHGGSTVRLDGSISKLSHLVRKSVSFQWNTSRQFPFFFEQQIMGGWEGKEMEGKGEREGLLFLKLCQALVLWKFL